MKKLSFVVLLCSISVLTSGCGFMASQYQAYSAERNEQKRAAELELERSLHVDTPEQEEYKRLKYSFDQIIGKNVRSRPRASTNRELQCFGMEHDLGYYLLVEAESSLIGGSKAPQSYKQRVYSSQNDPKVTAFSNKVIDEFGKDPALVRKLIESGVLYKSCVEL